MKNPLKKKAPERKQKAVSRRSFLRGAGMTTAGTVALSSGLLSFQPMERPPATAPVLGPGPVELTLKINGENRRLTIEPRTTLADALRDHLNLTGTKVVCDRGSCSACTVWIDEQPRLACMMLAVDVQNQEVTTIEGLAKNGELHPVQEAFIEHDASMCGFCTPGMVMSSAALLQRNPTPNLEDVKLALSGNLCRCGTYPKVFEATLAAAKKMK